MIMYLPFLSRSVHFASWGLRESSSLISLISTSSFWVSLTMQFSFNFYFLINLLQYVPNKPSLSWLQLLSLGDTLVGECNFLFCFVFLFYIVEECIFVPFPCRYAALTHVILREKLNGELFHSCSWIYIQRLGAAAWHMVQLTHIIDAPFVSLTTKT